MAGNWLSQQGLSSVFEISINEIKFSNHDWSLLMTFLPGAGEI